MPCLAVDERASFVTAVLPMFLATAGLLMLATGAVMALFPLLMLGAGGVVIAVAMYMIASFMDHTDRRRRRAPPSRADRARAAFQEERRQARAPPAPVRSPLADHAVAALTGSAEPGGIYPPLPSQRGGAAPRGRSATQANSAGPVPMWDPGTAPSPDAFRRERVVEFTEVRPEELQAAMVAGGGHTEPAWNGAPTTGASAAPAADQDFRIWPGAKNVDQWAMFTGERKANTSRVSDEDIRTAMVARRKEFAGRLPTVGAILAGVDARQDAAVRDMARGKCSQCESVIWAPKQRPILLKCPSCGHKAKLY